MDKYDDILVQKTAEVEKYSCVRVYRDKFGFQKHLKK